LRPLNSSLVNLPQFLFCFCRNNGSLSGALWRIIYQNTPLQQALEQAAALSSHELIRDWLKSAIAKVAESNDPSSALSRQEFVDDIAITSMTRLWDVGKSEPIKVGKASPTEGALPSALYFALKYLPAPQPSHSP
jgi:hypothetical protein